jgi:site-specific recombinase XerD
MKLVNRERVDGTQITIGKRVYYKDGKRIVATKFSTEYTDLNGKQFCRSLETTNVAQARRKVIKIQEQLERGIDQISPLKITIDEIINKYFETVKIKGSAPKTVRKYHADLDKLKDFCHDNNIRMARQFTENDLYSYRQHLIDKDYADKTVQGAVVVAKQMFKWAWRQKLILIYCLEAVSFPKAKAGPQPCFTSEQVDSLIQKATEQEKLAFALMGYAGLRIGEVEQLRWEDIIAKGKQFTMIHIRHGGSNGTTKDREERFVPIYPKIAELLPRKKNSGVLLPNIKARKLLERIKILCAECKFDDPEQYKLHTFRHHFASLCANHHIAYRKVLAWLGHSSSDILDLYYHLHDEDSQNAMMELAKSQNAEAETASAPNKGNLRATGESKISNDPQIPELKELINAILAEKEKPERPGFEPGVRVYTRTTV